MRVVIERTNRLRAAITALASITVLAACAGENIFSLTAGSGSVGPTVNVTAPAENLALALGDSVLVRADVNAPGGAASLEITSTYTGGAAAFTSYTNPALGSVTTLTVNRWLQPAAGQVVGSAYIVVQVTNLTGAVGRDSVKVMLN